MNNQNTGDFRPRYFPAWSELDDVELADGVRLYRDPSGRLPPWLLVGITLWVPHCISVTSYFPPNLVCVQFVPDGGALDISVGAEVAPGTLIETLCPNGERESIGMVTGNENCPLRMHDGGPLFLVDNQSRKIVHQN